MPNNLIQELREKLMLSKAELARKAAIDPSTLDRVEMGCACKIETKRKILRALGLDLSEENGTFSDDEV